MDFRRTSLAALAADVRSGRVAARDLAQHALDRIDALDGRVNAFVAVDAEAALTAAAAVDRRVAAGEDPGPLAGVPLAVKDTEDAAGYRTTYGSAGWAEAPPASCDSILVSRLKAAGCVVIGKTNTPELAARSETVNPTFGATRNPWDLARTPGGSSGGTAAAVAAGMVPLGTGSDGGGSIRIPSSACGLSGFKPSLGRIPDGGARPPDWHHLTTRGVLARRVEDVVQGLDAVLGPDPTDLRSLPMPQPSWLGALSGAHVPMRVAWSPTLGYSPLDSEVRAVCERAVRVLSDLGAEVVEVPVVFDDDPAATWALMTGAYNNRTLEHLRSSPVWDRLDPDLVFMTDLFGQATALDLVKAEDRCHHLNLRLVELFSHVRLLVTPTVATVPPLLGEPGLVDGVEDRNWVRFTYPFNMTRSPAGTVMAGFSSGGVPIGLQLVGPQHADLVVLRAMAALEGALGLDAVAPVEG